MSFHWENLTTHDVITTHTDECPLGYRKWDGALKRGTHSAPRAVRVPFAAMDGARVMSDSERTETADMAGPGHLLNDAAQSVTAALAAAPARTRELRNQVARAMMEAEGTPHDIAFGSAIAALNGFSRRYQGAAFSATDAGEKAALEKAAQAVAGYASAQLALRNPSPTRSVGLDATTNDRAAAQAHLSRTLSDGWR